MSLGHNLGLYTFSNCSWEKDSRGETCGLLHRHGLFSSFLYNGKEKENSINANYLHELD
jgi:hypothetical protein